MIRGTTPTHVFTSCMDLTDAAISEIYITYSQRDEVIFEKTIDDVVIEENKIKVKLTQEETLLLDDSDSLEIQAALKFEDGTVVRSKMVRTDVGRILKDEAI